jgi:hypothetical protein
MYKEILTIDHAHRRARVEGDLFRLDLLKASAWNYSAPTLIPDSRAQDQTSSQNFGQANLCTKLTDFKTAFWKAYPILKDIDLSNVLIAGGSVGKLVRKWEREDTNAKAPDLDLFLYGLGSMHKFEERLHRLLDDIYKRLRSYAESVNRASIARIMWKYWFTRVRARRNGQKKEETPGPQYNIHIHQKEGEGAPKLRELLDMKQDVKGKGKGEDNDGEEQDHKILTDELKTNPFWAMYQLPEEDPLEFQHIRCTAPGPFAGATKAYFDTSKKHYAKIHERIANDLRKIHYTWNSQNYTFQLNAPEDIISYLKEEKAALLSYTVPRISQTRGPNSLTLVCGDDTSHPVQLQVIFRCYSTISEILHGFDLGPSAIGFDGKDVWMTSLGRFAYEYGCMIVDSSRRSTTYEMRLVKYFKRGFDLICPDLDVEQVKKTSKDNLMCKMPQAIALPKLPFVLKQITGNRLSVEYFLIHDRLSQPEERERDVKESVFSKQSVSERMKMLLRRKHGSDYGMCLGGASAKRHLRGRARASCRRTRVSRSLSPPSKKAHGASGDNHLTTPGDNHLTTPGDNDLTTPGDDDLTTRMHLCMTNLERLLHNGKAMEDEMANVAADVKERGKDAKEAKKEVLSLPKDLSLGKDTMTSSSKDTMTTEQRLWFWSREYNSDTILGPSAQPHLTIENIQQIYIQMETTFDEISLVEALKVAKRFITVENLEVLTLHLTQLITLPLQDLIASHDGMISSRKMCIKEYIHKVLEKQIDVATTLFSALNKRVTIPWRVVDPQSQSPLTGSFYPVETTKQEWYGKFCVSV